MNLELPLLGLDGPLTLTPRWGDESNPLPLLGIGLALLLAWGLVFWLFRWEARLIRLRAAVALLSLRVLLLTCLWFVAFFQPQIAPAVPDVPKERVLIALDLSESMDLADPRTPQENLRLVLALGLEKNEELPRELVEAWLRGLESGAAFEDLPLLLAGEPEAGSTVAARRASRQRLLKRAADLKRQDIGRLILDAEGMGLQSRLEEHFIVETMSFADLVSTEDKRPSHSKGTDLSLPLLKAAVPTAGPKLRGLVLLSDGRHTWGQDPRKALSRTRGLPIFPVAPLARQPSPDLAIIAAPPVSGPRDSELKLNVKIKAAGLPAQDILVDLYKKGEKKPLVETRRIPHKGNARPGEEPMEHSTFFSLKLPDVGTHWLEVKAQPAKKDQPEITTRNNELQTVARVGQDKPRILLVDGEARWEYHYLASFLSRDPSIDLEKVLFHQPRLGVLPDDKLEKLGYARTSLPKVKDDKADDPLFTFDCILLGDVSPDELPPADRRRLHRYVSERGGTLILLSGKRHMPLDFLKKKEADDLFSELLPVSDLKVEMSKDAGFGITLTPLGKATSWLALEDDAAKNEATWQDLPLHFWALTGKARPGATLLAAPAFEKKPPPPDRGLLVYHSVGRGRVLWSGLESTWRFRQGRGDLYHHRFWGQVVLWAAVKDALPAGTIHVRFGTPQPVFGPEQKVDVAVRLGPDEALPTPE